MQLPSLKNVGVSLGKSVLGLTKTALSMEDTVRQAAKSFVSFLESREPDWYKAGKTYYGLQAKEYEGETLTEEEKQLYEASGKEWSKGVAYSGLGFAGGGMKMQTDPIIAKVTQSLKGAKSLRSVQETLYSVAKGEKLKAGLKAEAIAKGGEKGFIAKLGQLKGEMPKVQFESLRGKISQLDRDYLFNLIRTNPSLNEWQKLTTGRGLAKMFGQYGGVVPQKGELELMRQVFGSELVGTLASKGTLLGKIGEAGLQLANMPRAIMASFDLSAPFRQGLFLISHPKRFGQAFIKMFRQFGSERSFQQLMKEISSRPNYKLMQNSKLALTELSGNLTKREEVYMSQWAEKIPLVGRGIRASERAYVGFLNKLRADVFDDLVRSAEKQGLAPRVNVDLTKEIANFVNVMSGRGTLPQSLERSAVALNSFFFSPRLMASRLTILNPGYYIKSSPFVRKEALKSLFSVAGVGSTILGLAKTAGADVGTDPRSADFGKIKIEQTRIDMWGGTQQYIRSAAQLISGKYVSSVTGKELTLGEGYKPLTRYDILLRQVEAKEAPVFSFITDLLKQQDYMGQPVKITTEITNRFTPMALQDLMDIIQEDPDLIPLSVLGVFGTGLQTYKPYQSNKLPSLSIGGGKGGLPSLKGIGLPK